MRPYIFLVYYLNCYIGNAKILILYLCTRKTLRDIGTAEKYKAMLQHLCLAFDRQNKIKIKKKMQANKGLLLGALLRVKTRLEVFALIWKKRISHAELPLCTYMRPYGAHYFLVRDGPHLWPWNLFSSTTVVNSWFRNEQKWLTGWRLYLLLCARAKRFSKFENLH